MYARKLKIMLALMSVSLLYQNCGGEFNANGEGVFAAASVSDCAAGTQALFESTFYPFTTQNCVACHTAAGPGLGAFADPNTAAAYSAFALLSADTVASYATNTGHAPPHTGTQNNATITSIMSTWKTTTNCASAGTSGLISTKPKAMGLNTLGPNYGSGTASVITWDLSKDVNNVSGLVGTLQIKVYVDLHSIGPNDNSYNYVFVNPTILGNTDSNIHVRGLHIYINGTLAGTVTAYNVVDVVLPKGNTQSLISGIGQPYLGDIAPADQLSIDIDIIENTTSPETIGLPQGP